MAIPATPVEAARHVEDVVARSGTSFFWSMRVLPRDQRAAMFAVYAFCRAIDDIADGPESRGQKLTALGEWRREINRICLDGRAETPIGAALIDPVRRYVLHRDDFTALIDGMEMDATGPIVAPDLATLRLYCARVAGAVGLLSVRIFGIADDAGRRLADALGEAVQLVNISRDLDEDAELGRLYLPRELLERENVPLEPRAAMRHQGLDAVARAVLAMARTRFADAAAVMAGLERRTTRTPRIIHAVYSRLADRLEAAGFAFPRTHVRLGTAEKLAIALRHAF